MWFLDVDITYDYALPCPPLWAEVHRWINDTLAGLGAQLRMDPNLHRLFRDAGLPGPTVEGRIITGGADTAPIWFFVNVVRAFLPVMGRLGVADPAEVGIDSLESRLAAELAAHDAAAIVPPMTIAWTRVPGR